VTPTLKAQASSTDTEWATDIIGYREGTVTQHGCSKLRSSRCSPDAPTHDCRSPPSTPL
jgi:hypothetical protein